MDNGVDKVSNSGSPSLRLLPPPSVDPQLRPRHQLRPMSREQQILDQQNYPEYYLERKLDPNRRYSQQYLEKHYEYRLQHKQQRQQEQEQQQQQQQQPQQQQQQHFQHSPYHTQHNNNYNRNDNTTAYFQPQLQPQPQQYPPQEQFHQPQPQPHIQPHPLPQPLPHPLPQIQLHPLPQVQLHPLPQVQLHPLSQVLTHPLPQTQPQIQPQIQPQPLELQQHQQHYAEQQPQQQQQQQQQQHYAYQQYPQQHFQDQHSVQQPPQFEQPQHYQSPHQFQAQPYFQQGQQHFQGQQQYHVQEPQQQQQHHVQEQQQQHQHVQEQQQHHHVQGQQQHQAQGQKQHHHVHEQHHAQGQHQQQQQHPQGQQEYFQGQQYSPPPPHHDHDQRSVQGYQQQQQQQLNFQAQQNNVETLDDELEDHYPHHQEQRGESSRQGQAEASSSNSVIPRPKRQRVVQACEGCRKIKTRCDGKEPCAICVQRNIGCVYSTSTAKERSFHAQFMALLNESQEKLCQVEKRVERFNEMVQMISDSMLLDKAPGPGGAAGPAQTTRAPKRAVSVAKYPTEQDCMLEWPALSSLLDGRVPSPADYPLSVERQRCLDLLGLTDPNRPGGSLLNGPASGMMDLSTSENAELDASGCLSTTTIDSILYRSSRSARKLDLDQATIWTLVKSYEKYVERIFPLVGPNNLKSMTNRFLRRVASMDQGITPPETEQIIDVALIISVLALGKVCLAGEQVKSHNACGPAAPAMGFGAASPASFASSPRGFTPMSSVMPSVMPGRGATSPDRMQIDSNPSFLSEDQVPVGTRPDPSQMPGHDYMECAAEVLGTQVGGFSASHVCVHMIAGLYYGQLGRVLDSYSHIQQAAVKIEQLMKGKFKNKMANLPFETKICFLFWNCLQLENDLMQHLKLPRSGLERHTGDMPYPQVEVALDDGYEGTEIKTYLTHIHLMKQSPAQVGKNVGIIEIQTIVENVGKSIDFPEDGASGSNPVEMRLWVKYWGTLVQIYRPVIKSVLSRPSNRRGKDRASNSAEAIKELEEAGKGIRALFESTKALQGLSRHWFLGDVFAIGHAQWTNLMILSAAYRHGELSNFVDGNTLRDLFGRTIRVLEAVALPGSALIKDVEVLKEVGVEMFAHNSTTVL